MPDVVTVTPATPSTANQAVTTMIDGDVMNAASLVTQPSPGSNPNLTLTLIWSYVVALCVTVGEGLITLITGSQYTFAAGTLQSVLTLIANTAARVDGSNVFLAGQIFASGVTCNEGLIVSNTAALACVVLNASGLVTCNAGLTVPTGQTLTIASGGTLALNGSLSTTGFTCSGLITAQDGVMVTSGGSLTVASDLVMSGTQPASSTAVSANTFFALHLAKSLGSATWTGNAGAVSVADGVNDFGVTTIAAPSGGAPFVRVTFATAMGSSYYSVHVQAFDASSGNVSAGRLLLDCDVTATAPGLFEFTVWNRSGASFLDVSTTTTHNVTFVWTIHGRQ